MRVEEVAQELGISKSHAYKVIHKLNAELREKGYLDVYKRQVVFSAPRSSVVRFWRNRAPFTRTPNSRARFTS